MTDLDQQMGELLGLDGVLSVCLVHWHEGRALVCHGADDTGRAAQTAAVVRAVAEGPLQQGRTVEEIVVTDGGHHMIYTVLARAGLCLQVRMDRERGSLGRVLHRLRRLADEAQPPVPDVRRRRGTPDPGTAATTVERSVLVRVLSALRELSVGSPRAGEVVG
ncbi:hypothetical protein [Streptomonospora salina]|uniref:Roadblock/LAMTOR2 domain-containing protein n=1 Tax=Streptomonospora salina TaxID=104205 RepID=A0A841ECD8_9ACTN|nr:hypothetical protein [Streptomonospora salina]MBB5998989.1 hypothetical protein [Streptomonospora salina]